MRSHVKALGLLLALGAAQAAAPPVGGPVRLTADQQRQIDRLDRQALAALAGERFEEAAEKQRQAVALRERWQGQRHWQAIDARLALEECQRLVRIPVKERGQVVRARRLNGGGLRLIEQGRYRAAEEKMRQALAILRKVLGEGHADTAAGYNNVASCLQAQGQHLLAQPLFEKALAIRRKALGEEHPDTARGYNSVALCLDAQGQHAHALPLFRKALAINRKALGEEHPTTATSCNNVATCLNAQGQHARALPLFEKALTIRLAVMGEEHSATATSYNNVASCLNAQGQHARALPLYEKALAICRKTLGEEHPRTASSYSNLANCLDDLGQHARALPLYEKGLAISRKVLGEESPDTAICYNNVAFCLHAQGQNARALPLFEKALAIWRTVLGEGHPDTATGYGNVALCLGAQGKYAQALPLYEKALAISRKVLGEEHPRTALASNNLAGCLHAQGQYARALPLFEKALAIFRKVRGEEHPDTAACYNAEAACLHDQGQHARALPLFEKALAIFRKALGEEHPDTARGYNNVASCLDAQGQHARALPLHEKALAIDRKALGEEHPDTAQSYDNLASCLDDLGRWPEAVRLLQASLPGQEAARFHQAPSGFDRAFASARRFSPHEYLAAGLAQAGQPGNAFRHAEAHLARGLLDDLARPIDSDKAALAALNGRLRSLDGRLVSLFGRQALSKDQQRLREELTAERRLVQAELSRLASAVSARQLLDLGAIQAQLPADAALVLWLDNPSLGQPLACIVRHRGRPAWVSLPGPGKGRAWAKADRDLADRLYRLLQSPVVPDGERDGPETLPRLVEAVRRQRLAPLRPHLVGVRHLLVVPTGWAGRVPLEVLSTGYRISYVPSGSVFARLRQKHRAAPGATLLALGDPLFTVPAVPRPEPPARGVMLAFVQPGGGAHRAGLRSGDVLVRVGEAPVATVDDLKKALAAGRAVRYWREGEQRDVGLPAGPLGVRVDGRPPPLAVAARREAGASVVSRGPAPLPLPGTRREVEALSELVPHATRLLGKDASERRLSALAERKELKRFRLVHLATHGRVDERVPGRSALLLAEGGELPVSAVRRWELSADLVVLSACQTALGAEGAGEGLLGFAQAFLQAGARSVVLSRWQVDDEATALLMVRFYRNLLGKRDGLKGPMPKAEALQEAKDWLRNLSAKEVKAEAERLPRGKGAKPIPLRKEVRPFEHPYYWGAFVLIGDPG
jgi:tetratricopeptide (TPR) repeat protein